jgi:outer membrane immunogenic protein
MSNPFSEAWPPVRRLILAGYLVTATIALSKAAIAADMPLKASVAPYQWSGCYVGLNLGGGASGTNFTSRIDPGTHLLGADPALVAADGSGGANADGVLAGGQAGCNWQTGTLCWGWKAISTISIAIQTSATTPTH